MGLNPTDRARSPRFPSHSLGDTIVYAEKIYRGVHRSSIDAQTAYRLMGFAGKSGTSATALGSVRQFGLIEGAGDSTRISQLALRILEPVTPQERTEAIVEASEKPEVFRAVLNRFDGGVPTADEPVRAFLIRELGFSKGGAEDCLESLRRTLDMVKDLAVGTSSPAVSQHNGPPAPTAGPVILESQTHGEPVQHFMRIPLTRECSVELRFSGNVTEKAIANLIRHIELTREIWTDSQD